MKVADIMTREVITIFPETKVTEAAKVLFDHNFNGLPVISAIGEVVGLVTEASLLAQDSFGMHIPSLIKMLQDFKVLNQTVSGKDKKEFRRILNATAEAVMETDFSWIGPESPVSELLRIFNEKHANPVPVLTPERKLAGIVSRSDIIKLVSRTGEAELDFLFGGGK